MKGSKQVVDASGLKKERNDVGYWDPETRETTHGLCSDAPMVYL